jgi:uncharacterized protein (DUF58 family)
MTRLAHTGLGDVTSAETAIRAVVSIAEATVAQRHRVGLFLVGNEVRELPFAGGPGQLNEILDWLTLARVEGELIFHEAVAEQLPRVRRGATAAFVVCASRLDPDGMESILHHLQIGTVKTIVALVDDTTYTKIWPGQERQQREALPLEELARRFTLAGAQVYRLARGDNLRAKLETGTKRAVFNS